MFQRLIALARRLFRGADSSTSSEEERRVWVRYPSSVEAVVTPLSNGAVESGGHPQQRLSAQVRNISRGGVSLVVDKPFEAGDMISLELPHRTPGETETVLACVVRSQQLDPAHWSLGCSFSEELSEDDLSAFGARKERPAKPENRAWKRFGCSVQANCSLVSDPAQKAWPAQVVNISAGGIGLQVRQAVESGAVLNLKLSDARGQSERNVLACVVHVVKRPEDWLLGCNFIHELSEKDLQALV